MKEHPQRELLLLRLGIAASLAITALVLFAILYPAYSTGILISSPKILLAGAGFILLCIFEVFLLIVSYSREAGKFLNAFHNVAEIISRLGKLNLLILAVITGVFCWLVIGTYSWYFQGISQWMILFIVVISMNTVVLKMWQKERAWAEIFLASLFFTSAACRLAAFLSEVTAYPFSLYWSETTRFYYGSLYFAERIYGQPTPLPGYDVSRTLLQAFPFLLPELPLWAHRLWQACLWIGITFWTAWVLARRLVIRDGLKRWMLVAAAILWLLLGPVYFQLQLCVLLVLWGVERDLSRRPAVLKSMLAIGLASIWAGLSRINWFPVPALLAVMLYLLEQPRGGKSLFRYLALPAAWCGLGALLALATQIVYILISGVALDTFAYVFSSNILWYRLLPNPTFPTGILPTVLAVTLPVLILIWLGKSIRGLRLDGLRWLGICAILAALFLGGLMVSAKSGGGNNLHNLDAYLTVLFVLGAMVYFNQVDPWPPVQGTSLTANRYPGNKQIEAALSILIATGLVISGLSSMDPAIQYSKQEADADLQLLQEYTQLAATKGPVLFLTERQLLTFGEIEGVALTPEYEKVWLIMQAMAGNQPYLDRLHDDIRQRRFSLIVSDPLWLVRKGTTAYFGDENDFWVEEVAQYILCYYKPVKVSKKKLEVATIRWYVPRLDVRGCP